MGVGALSQGATIIVARVCRSAGASESVPVWFMAQGKALIVGAE